MTLIDKLHSSRRARINRTTTTPAKAGWHQVEATSESFPEWSGVCSIESFQIHENLRVSDAANSRYITAQPSHLATDTQKQVERQKKDNEVRNFELLHFSFNLTIMTLTNPI
jgi:hypothetical protein